MTALTQYDEALSDLERTAAACRSSGNLEEEARVTAEMGRLHFLRGTPREGIARLRSMLDRMPDDATPNVPAALYASLAPLYWVTGRYRALLAAATEGASLAAVAEGKASALYAEAEVWLGIALLALERIEEGMQVLEAAIPLAEAAGDLMSVSRGYNSMAATYQDRGEVDREVPYLERALDAAERLGDPARLAFMLYRRGWHEWVTGDWGRARADLERALALNEEAGPSWVTPYVHYGLGSLFFVEGDWPAAMQHLTRCIDAAERRGDVRVRWAAKSLMAERDLLEGRPQAVRERLEPLLDSAGLEEAGVTLLLAYLAQAHLAMGDAQKAEALIRRAAAHATDESYRPTRAEVRRIQGIIAAHLGRPDEAEQALDEALALTRAVRNPYAEARVLHACGLVDARKGDRLSAERRLQEAAGIFRRLGARTDLEQTESMLAAL